MALLTSLPEEFASSFSRAVALALKQVYGERLLDVTEQALGQVIEQQLPSLFPKSLSLIRTRPDYESVLAALMREVEKSSVWADSDISATGQMLLRAIAADVDYGQFSIARALQEAFPDTARSDDAVLLNARALGNRISRNKPAKLLAIIDRPDTDTILSIPAYEPWTVRYEDDNVTFFNRQIAVFNTGEPTLNVELFEGTPSSLTVVSSGVRFQTIEVGFENGLIGEDDFRVFVDGEEWIRVSDPLWHYGPTDKVFWETTLSTKNVEIRFGSGDYGAVPAAGINIDVYWVETKGGKANRPEFGLKVTAPVAAQSGFGSLTGLSTSAAANGADALPVEYYKHFAGNQRASGGRAVRRSDFRDMALRFGTPVKDALFRGQAEIAPSRPSMMNIVEATILAVPPMTQGDWLAFQEYMDRKMIYRVELRRRDPIIIPMTINAEVYCRPEANLGEAAERLRQRIYTAFEPSPYANSLSYPWFMSDITSKLEGTDDLGDVVEYIKLISPAAEIEYPQTPFWVQLEGLTLAMSYTTRSKNFAGRRDRTSLFLRYDASGLQVD